MKKFYMQPETEVIEVEMVSVIATSLDAGDPIGEGEDVPADAPGRRWNY